jgi:large subunit ribosomal protein L22
MAEIVSKKLTRKEKIAAGIEKGPKKKTASANLRKSRKQEVISVSLRNHRGSARKSRLIADSIRGLEVFDALGVLKFTSKAAAPAVTRLLKSAISSCEEKFDGERVDVGTHFIKMIKVDGGRMLKRVQPAPQGRAHMVRKRFCHITLEIDRIREEETE